MSVLDRRPVFDDLLALLPIDDLAKNDLARRMRAPDRHYHSDAHLEFMWSCNLRMAEAAGLDGTATQRRLACAIAFHDSVVVPGRNDNEVRSAELWLAVSADAVISLEDRLAVSNMIEATADHVGVASQMSDFREHHREVHWLLDLDLASLGEAPEVFDRNTTDLRREAAYLDEASWQNNVEGFFTKLLAAEPLFRCCPIATRFESAARANMIRSLHKFGDERARVTHA